MIRSKLRKLAEAVSPELLNGYRSHRLRNYFRQRYGELQEEAYKILFDRAPPKVLSGPFRGMPYLNEIVWGPIIPKWIGCYEVELHEVIEQLVIRKYLDLADAAERLETRFQPIHHVHWFTAESRESQVYKYQSFWVRSAPIDSPSTSTKAGPRGNASSGRSRKRKSVSTNNRKDRRFLKQFIQLTLEVFQE